MMLHRVLGALVVGFVSIDCAGSRHFHAVDHTAATTRGVPRYIELREKVRVATLHFPSGLYALDATDDAGFYYRAPQKIVEHSFAGSRLHEGGVYLRKGRHGQLRGYVYWHGGLTHVGDLSRADYAFRD